MIIHSAALYHLLSSFLQQHSNWRTEADVLLESEHGVMDFGTFVNRSAAATAATTSTITSTSSLLPEASILSERSCSMVSSAIIISHSCQPDHAFYTNSNKRERIKSIDQTARSASLQVNDRIGNGLHARSNASSIWFAAVRASGQATMRGATIKPTLTQSSAVAMVRSPLFPSGCVND